MAAFQGKQYLDISMSRPQRKNVSLVINPLNAAAQAHMTLETQEKNERDAFTEDSVYRGRCWRYIHKSLFSSLYFSVSDLESI